MQRLQVYRLGRSLAVLDAAVHRQRRDRAVDGSPCGVCTKEWFMEVACTEEAERFAVPGIAGVVGTLVTGSTILRQRDDPYQMGFIGAAILALSSFFLLLTVGLKAPSAFLQLNGECTISFESGSLDQSLILYSFMVGAVSFLYAVLILVVILSAMFIEANRDRTQVGVS